ncbi:MAG: YHS domain-containing protein [Candidatus Rokuibacteriota bacterium]
MAKDPVCGMTVDEKKAAATAMHDGTTYFFCAAACKDKFVKNPKQYTGGKKPS